MAIKYPHGYLKHQPSSEFDPSSLSLVETEEHPI